MAIKFEDTKTEKAVKPDTTTPKPVSTPTASDATRVKRQEEDAPVLPFAKPTRPDKKKRGG